MRITRKYKIIAVFTLMTVLSAIGLGIIADRIIYPMAYYPTVSKYCAEYGVEPSLVMAVIKAESGFRPRAVSEAGAVGLMQIMPETAVWLTGGEVDLFVPEVNIEVGVKYLKYLSAYFSGKELIGAYNAGEGKMRVWSDYGEWYPETRAYVEKVLSYKSKYSERIIKYNN